MRRSKHSLSHYRLLTADMGFLVPLTWYEALPGDSIQQRTSMLVRVSPLVSPVMHPVTIRIHHWFVPNRLIWDGWEPFITGGPDGKNADMPPMMQELAIEESSLHDYLGVPTGDYTPALQFSALPFRAYQLIWNEMYRDQDLSAEVVISKDSGIDSTTETELKKVAWAKDYFTTARPWEQKGDSVTIPIGDKAPLTGIGVIGDAGQGNRSDVRETGKSSPVTYDDGWMSDSPNVLMVEEDGTTNYPNIYADLSDATGISVNELREALAIQRYQEARAMYGSRYVEYLRYLGVRSSDARLQNPEYLGGGRQIISFSEVLRVGGDHNQAEETIGDLKGHGIAGMRTNRFRRFFEEHGIVMTLMSVIPKSIYLEALPKKFSRLTKEEYFQKELQFLGDQAILNEEVQAGHTDRGSIFGYQNRYDDYRQCYSGVSGEFRSTLNYWHYARDFGGDVALNSSFVEATPTKRVNADAISHCLYVMSNHSIQSRRMVIKDARPRTF